MRSVRSHFESGLGDVDALLQRGELPVIVELGAAVGVVDVPRPRDSIGNPEIVKCLDQPTLTGRSFYAHHLGIVGVVKDELRMGLAWSFDFDDVGGMRTESFPEDRGVIFWICSIFRYAGGVETALVDFGRQAAKAIRVLMPAAFAVLPVLVHERAVGDPRTIIRAVSL